MHRDIKGANILISQDGIVKLTDFGTSKHLKSESNGDGDTYSIEECFSFKGSPYWIAPEVVKKEGHGFPADIWSVGCVTIELLTGNPPFYDHKDVKEVLEIIKSESSEYFN